MARKEANYDKTLLGIAALLALAVAGYIFTLKGSFNEKLATPKVPQRADFPTPPLEEVNKTIGNLQTKFNWTSPIKNGKPVPLNKSISVVHKDGQLVDMFVEQPQLRPPMTNKFLRENKLEYLSANVGDLDPDGDGFSNLEEFNKNTNPKDPASHPPLTDKLYFKERVQNDYEMELKSPEPPLIVKLNKPNPATAAPFIQPPFPLDFGFVKGAQPRFTATAFEKKTAANPKTGLPEDASELAVTDKITGTKFVLVYKKPYNLAEYQAVLEYRIGTVQVITVKKGDTFRINGLGSTFKLIDVTEENATVADMEKPDKPFTVGKRP